MVYVSDGRIDVEFRSLDPIFLRLGRWDHFGMAARGHGQRLEVLGISWNIFCEGDGKVLPPHVLDLILVIACEYVSQ
jgi:hypothetical protein